MSIWWCEGGEGFGTISVDLSLFGLHYYTNIMNKYKLKNNSLTVKSFYNLHNHPTFHSGERLAFLGRGRERFVGLSLLLV